ncbi:MAG: PilZ domain-containing protein [Sulfuriflexus sp.]|nr:PilZ domain-containing protein [Sulfuriflexus sp.]
MKRKMRNRRWSKRKAYVSSVSIRCLDGSVKEHRIINISPEGLLVEPSMDWADEGSLFELDIPLRLTGEKIIHRVPVSVVYTSDSGTGLMFMRHDREILGLISNTVYRKPDEQI